MQEDKSRMFRKSIKEGGRSDFDYLPTTLWGSSRCWIFTSAYEVSGRSNNYDSYVQGVPPFSTSDGSFCVGLGADSKTVVDPSDVERSSTRIAGLHPFTYLEYTDDLGIRLSCYEPV
jgi:hypothetical protein